VHLTTWAVLGGLLVVLLIAMAWRKDWWRAGVVIAVAVVVTVTSFSLRPKAEYENIVLPDVEVVKGVAPLWHFGNARGLIWKRYVDQYAALPLYAQLFGMTLAGEDEMSGTGFGAHNDFLRILMTTGVVGLLLYLIWLGRTVRAVFRLRGEWRFLGVGALVIWVGFSVGLTPTFIVPLSVGLLPILGGLGRITEINKRATQIHAD
jgi:O-antigen ligase